MSNEHAGFMLFGITKYWRELMRRNAKGGQWRPSTRYIGPLHELRWKDWFGCDGRWGSRWESPK